MVILVYRENYTKHECQEVGLIGNHLRVYLSQWTLPQDYLAGNFIGQLLCQHIKVFSWVSHFSKEEYPNSLPGGCKSDCQHPEDQTR